MKKCVLALHDGEHNLIGFKTDTFWTVGSKWGKSHSINENMQVMPHLISNLVSRLRNDDEQKGAFRNANIEFRDQLREDHGDKLYIVAYMLENEEQAKEAFKLTEFVCLYSLEWYSGIIRNYQNSYQLSNSI